MKFNTVGALLMSALFIGWSGIAAAALCKDVSVNVKNDFQHDEEAIQIKVVDFDYYDDTEGKWREENFVGNTVVDPGDTRFITKRNLEYVGNESDVIVRVQYKYMTEKNGWSETLNAQSARFYCKKDGPNSVTVTVTPL